MSGTGFDIILELLRDIRPSIGLQKLLEEIIRKLGQVAWLKLDGRGAILLLNAHDELILVASYGFSEQRSRFCERVGLERCACGEVVRSRDVAFLGCMGESELGHPGINHVILPLLDGGRILGVMPLFVPEGHRTTEAEIALLRDISLVVSNIVSRLLMEEIVQVKQMELEKSKAEIISKLSVASEYRDTETGMHVMRMAHYANAIAKVMGMPVSEREQLVIAAPMHDVGKIGIPDNIMLKPGRLTTEEFEAMKEHTRIGERILNGDDMLMHTARVIALSHHEKWDGSGYPNGIRGEAIPLTGRICAVADVFDALTSTRPYKERWPVERAINLIEEESGRSFDPAVIRAFREALPEILRIKELYRDEIIDPHEKLELPPLPEPVSAWITWDGSLSIGIDVIDEHHRYLFNLINDLYAAVTEGQGCATIVKMLGALEHYTVIHFREEEKMMRRYVYRRMEQHVAQHDLFRKKVAAYWNDLMSSPLTLGQESLLYLRSWLTNHITKEDILLSELSSPNFHST